MKIAAIALLLLPFASIAQTKPPSKKKSKGYAQLAASFFQSEETNVETGIAAGAGFSPHPNVSIGAAFEFYIFGKGPKYTCGFIDARIYLVPTTKPVSPYISFQPGLVLYNSALNILGTRIQTTGDFALNAFIGVKANRSKGIGPFFNVGYSRLGFKTNDFKYHYNGFKAQLGMSF